MQQLDTQRISQLANQIAENQQSLTDQEAIQMVDEHIHNFWNSSMIKLLTQADDNQLHRYCRAVKQRLLKSGYQGRLFKP